jgi:hypothetical protein
VIGIGEVVVPKGDLRGRQLGVHRGFHRCM